MRFWTVSYVAIDDHRLALTYYGGVALIALYFLWGVLFDKGYLEYDQVQGVCRPSLALPQLAHNSSRSKGSRCGLGSAESCSPVPLEEVELEPGAGQILIATHIREKLETCSDTFCRLPQSQLKMSEFYVADIEEYTLAISCNAQSFRFFAEDCHYRDDAQEKLQGLGAPYHLRGRSQKAPLCRFAAANRRLHGRLLGPGGKVIQEIPPGSGDAFQVSTWLDAAGIKLDSLSDALEAPDSATHRRAGMVMLVTVAYHNHPSERAFWDLFSIGERASVMAYDVEVRRIAEAGYHVSRATVHEDSGGGASTRELHEAHGILLQFELSGRVGRFSWQALADELVLKLGWLTLLQLLLDVFWQYVLPLTGINYNYEVYRWKVKSRRDLTTPKLV